MEGEECEIIDYTFATHSVAKELGIGDEYEVLTNLGYDPDCHIGEYYRVKERAYIFRELGLLKDANDEIHLRELSKKQHEMVDTFLETKGNIADSKEENNQPFFEYFTPKYEKWSKYEAKQNFHNLIGFEPRDEELPLFFSYLDSRREVRNKLEEIHILKGQVEELKQEIENYKKKVGTLDE